MDRLEVIQMPSYTDEEKITIGRDYILPKVMKEAGLDGNEIKISPDVWASIVRPTGFDAGVRTLQRTLEGLCRKSALLILSGRVKEIVIDSTNVKKFIPQW